MFFEEKPIEYIKEKLLGKSVTNFIAINGAIYLLLDDHLIVEVTSTETYSSISISISETDSMIDILKQKK